MPTNEKLLYTTTLTPRFPYWQEWLKNGKPDTALLGYRVRSRKVDSSAHQELRPELIGEESDDRRPSEVIDAFWIHAERRDRSSYPDHTERGGKWMLFIKTLEIDSWWSKIKAATEGGVLGGSAKVATMKQIERREC